MYDIEGGGDWLFTTVPILIGIIFVIVFIAIIANSIKGISQWNKNENSPRLSTPAVVKTKRTNVTRHGQNHSTTTYFVTFQFESGDRSEFRVSGKEYGMLAEEDIGTLTFQGTRYIDFVRG
ncbi:DUF2500 domain-containing protein [Bacillus sp. FJAT-42315]|uniref:DUF2500 domain-containing protein n=1 Tax=Bacillus sp. FJAT-42315 TaxID=2014077 RepID=UPI000BA955DC|nr:DUF2500 domain-containing protein [Bacillus sp. FJAT-42315]PAQ14950.1 hypothetical protein CD798_08660 [Bacillaceae bacterium SAOS 7]